MFVTDPNAQRVLCDCLDDGARQWVEYAGSEARRRSEGNVLAAVGWAVVLCAPIMVAWFVASEAFGCECQPAEPADRTRPRLAHARRL